MPRIENWSVGFGDDNPYLPPEGNYVCLRGLVYDHPRLEDGKPVKTSAIVAARGRSVWTERTRYELGQIDPAYRKWLRENRPDWDWRQPVTAPPPKEKS